MAKKMARSLGVLGIGCLVVVAASCQGTEEPAEGRDDRSGQHIQTALDAIPGAAVVDVDEAGVPSFVTGTLGRLVVKDPANVTMAELRPALSQISAVFLASPEDLVLKNTQVDDLGDQHFRFTQFRNGLEVLGGELVVHVRDGAIYAANGSARGDLEAPSEPVIDVEAAMVAAKSGAGSVSDLAVGTSAHLAYRLSGSRLHMVYVVKVTGFLRDLTPVDDDVLVNAVDGSIVDRIPHIHTAKNREMHNLNHGTSLPGPLARTEGQAANADAIVNNNYDRLGTTWDCYKNLFNRDSFDNAGAKLISSVHYSNNYVNAYWNGTQMVYGDGDGVQASSLANSMDVTAHELTHAVTEKTSNLTYSGESGGLNESMSDVFGNVCEWYRDGQVVSANTWKVGEDIWTPGTAGDALRYMNDPILDGGSLDLYTASAGNVDVHYSSGISNLAFYLLAQGGTHPRGKTSNVVTGIGIAKAAQIFYRANTSIMTSGTNFAGAKTATEQAATQLGYTAAEIASVTAAWQAVGVGVVVPPPPTVVLTNGVTVNGISGAAGSLKYYSLAVPAGSTALSFVMAGGTGDADVYVKFGSAPTTTSYDCRPYLGGNAETCNIASAQTGTYYVMIRGYSAYTNTTLKGQYTAGGGGGACTHNKCTAGAKLVSGCDPCVTQICAVDAYCCNTSWDSICVGQVSSVCGLSCP